MVSKNSLIGKLGFKFFMRIERLELSRIFSPDSKSGASTNYATSALREYYTEERESMISNRSFLRFKVSFLSFLKGLTALLSK